jgi:HSP20 family molecular chaperone IbpA
MSVNRTVTEFTSRRKIIHGVGAGENNSQRQTSTAAAGSLQSEAATSQHKTYFTRNDDDGTENYIILFNIGEFHFDELNIRTEGQKLFVQGHQQQTHSPDLLSKEFKREFKLPHDVDSNSIKAHLNEQTRELKLTGKILKESDKLNPHSNNGNVSSGSSSSNGLVLNKIGEIKEKLSSNSIDFEIYLGEQLNDGQIIFEVPNLVTLNVRCIKTEQDGFGSFNLELKREIKLPNGAKLNNISHSIDNGILFIQVPFK